MLRAVSSMPMVVAQSKLREMGYRPKAAATAGKRGAADEDSDEESMDDEADKDDEDSEESASEEDEDSEDSEDSDVPAKKPAVTTRHTAAGAAAPRKTTNELYGAAFSVSLPFTPSAAHSLFPVHGSTYEQLKREFPDANDMLLRDVAGFSLEQAYNMLRVMGVTKKTAAPVSERKKILS